MTIRATFTIDSENASFLANVASSNKSAYINQLIREDRLRELKKKFLIANLEEAQDHSYQKELHDWDSTLLDGLDSDV